MTLLGCEKMVVSSAGGVVVLGNSVLLLRKLNGDWVLPKGRIEENEEPQEAARREVREESGIKTELLCFVGDTTYDFRSGWNSHEKITKKVYWYLMTAKNMHLVPQREEGFAEAKFIHNAKVEEIVRYEDEKQIIKKALSIYEEKYKGMGKR
jgi:8-oxo-dGTP pyrophosphatase MutT (NUDIX family)